ncbi:uncharacterized protein TRAVEDRAFT_54435 [Trametes versicolor FP-101664 SS1]|uniref:C2H2-type domain-containing protein n=1 Tax=Trametes versicolor (strain FP-101664) TaxID=717944 RepID=R7S7R7_TRAVS|nr:uncharacterized protein TRAVEDRAFT_54435 [Trametes versicolor FP-101664 SS1]EIW51682.1 hypothetical protein TRAVEDRAFT_54435 [Trametes versicolor FP-101664 SS1]
MSVDPPPSPEPENEASELYDVPEGTLATWGFQINRRLEALVCVGCKSVVTPTAAVSHHHKPPAAAISHHRKPAKLRVDRNVLQALVDEGSIQSGWPTVTPGDVEYQGLERKWGAACPQEGCSLMFTNKKHAIAHALDIHKLAVNSVDMGWMQRLSHYLYNLAH